MSDDMKVPQAHPPKNKDEEARPTLPPRPTKESKRPWAAAHRSKISSKKYKEI